MKKIYHRKTKRNTLFSNKKGILSGITNVVMAIVNFVKDTIPKPVLFLIFLFILLLFGQLFTYVFNVFGVFCNTADQPVRLDTNPFNSISLIAHIPDPKLVGLEAIQTEDILFSSNQVDSCARQIQRGTYLDKDGLETIITNPTWFYDGRFCTNCNQVRVQEKDSNNQTYQTFTLCEGNVARKNTSDKTITQKLFCDSAIGFGCQPPANYYYSPVLNLYLCDSDSCAGKTIGDAWNTRLEEYGATLMYKTLESGKNPSYKQVVGITCQDFHPKLSVYGIDIFDIKLWMFILLIIILLWGLKIASQIRQ